MSRLLAGFLCLTASAWASDKTSDASSWSVPVPQAASTETLKALQAELAEIQAQKAKVQAEKEVLGKAEGSAEVACDGGYSQH